MQPRLVLLTTLVMLAFALNSLLCREALLTDSISAVDFTLARLVSGALVLWLICAVKYRQLAIGGDWASALALFGYAACFSLAYISLGAATGALVLFGAVQITMIAWGLVTGERLSQWQWLGAGSAAMGLAWFVFPGVTAPPLLGAGLMVVAGVCWGFYSLRGRRAGNATQATAGNFIRSTPFVILLYLVVAKDVENPSLYGWTLALLSGAVASGLGYALWYAVLPSLAATTSATVQLSVPIITAVLGVMFLGEALTLRLLVASVVVLGGIFIFINARRKHQ